jgi:cell wall-associated NlpC family hydrolase
MLWVVVLCLLMVACVPVLLLAAEDTATSDPKDSREDGAGGCSQVDPDEAEERTEDLDVDPIPASVFRFYCAAAQAYQMDWAILAGVGREECRHGLSELDGCSPEGSVNDAGARGPMQFLGSTWRGSADKHDPDVAGPPVCVNRDDDQSDDQVCEDTTGYATDGDGDGTADPWNWSDATYSAARMLVANGVKEDPRQAIRVYNHSDEYVADVMADAGKYRDAIAPLVQTDTDTATTPEREEVLRRADSWIGPDGQGVPYSQGAYHDGWRTDCSGFVSMAWNLRTANGDKLNTNTVGLSSTHAVPISRSDLEPGDIILNATGGPNDRHVVLFERWDADSNYYWAYEQAGGVGTVHRRIRYPYGGDAGYSPYRLKVAT